LRSGSTGATVCTVFTAGEVFRWFTERTFQGLSAVEIDGIVAALTAAETEGRSVYETAQRLEPLLLHATYEWPTLLRWRRRFKDAGMRPDWLPLFDPRHGEENRREEIMLFAGSALGAWAGARRLASLLDSSTNVPDIQAEVFGPDQDDTCVICRPRAGQRFDPRSLPEGGIPPFHPGCRCCLTPFMAGWASELADIDRENERRMEERMKTWSPEARATWKKQRKRRKRP